MGAFLRSVLNHQSDVHYDEANPQFRFIFGSTHCLNVLKYSLIFHISISIFLSLHFIPFSIFAAPMFVVVLGTGVFSMKSYDELALLPFQIYLLILFVCASIASIVCPIAVYLYKDEFLGHFGYYQVSSQFVTMMVVFNVMLLNLVMTAVFYYQYKVCLACRIYFKKVREQGEYAHLSIPESFVNPNTPINCETEPFVGKKSADYTVFTLDQVDLNDSTDDEKTKEVEKDVEKA